MRYILLIAVSFTLISCASAGKTLKYGFLPGSDYQYYKPLNKVDLKGKKYNITVLDARDKDHIYCHNRKIPRDTELEGSRGITYFENYVKAMIVANNGIVDPTGDTIEIHLKAISGDLRALVYGHVFGLVEFSAPVGETVKLYCSAMVDGDDDAPLGKMSFDTRKGAFRKLVSGSTRRALERYIHDLANVETTML